mmetsp:Transcript_13514/g.37442  ORF Transcript_13514/g.37442 Transcript_13514/m.37442 type:complete len:225 (-) Transcript_13514:44-718(-)
MTAAHPWSLQIDWRRKPLLHRPAFCPTRDPPEAAKRELRADPSSQTHPGQLRRMRNAAPPRRMRAAPGTGRRATAPRGPGGQSLPSPASRPNGAAGPPRPGPRAAHPHRRQPGAASPLGPPVSSAQLPPACHSAPSAVVVTGLQALLASAAAPQQLPLGLLQEEAAALQRAQPRKRPGAEMTAPSAKIGSQSMTYIARTSRQRATGASAMPPNGGVQCIATWTA